MCKSPGTFAMKEPMKAQMPTNEVPMITFIIEEHFESDWSSKKDKFTSLAQTESVYVLRTSGRYN